MLFNFCLLLWFMPYIAVAGAPSVTVYGSGTYSNNDIDVKIYADIIDCNLLSFGVEISYNPDDLKLDGAEKNEAIWYFGDDATKYPYLNPYMPHSGSAVIFGGKYDIRNPWEGVQGERILLGTVSFIRKSSSASDISIGHPGTDHKNFITTKKIIMDDLPGGVVWGPITLAPRDSDNDGLTDIAEITFGTDPSKIDSDGDGVQDGTELGVTLSDIGSDTDTSIFIPDADPSTTSDPLNADSDGDGLTDGQEDSNFNGMVDPGESDSLNADFPAYWTRIYSFSDVTRFSSLSKAHDGGYVISGEIGSSVDAKRDASLVKVNASGNFEWVKTLDGGNNDWFYDVKPDAHGGYIAAGYANLLGAGKNDFWLIRFDSNWQIIWQKLYGGAYSERAENIIPSADGGYIVTGYINTEEIADIEAWIIKLNSAGDIEWQRSIGGTAYDRVNGVIEAKDRSILVSGNTESLGADSMDGWLVKFDRNGNLLWQKTYGGVGDDWLGSAVEITGGYLVVGYTESFGSGSMDGWVLKIDELGIVEWQKTYGGSGSDSLSRIISTENGFILSGQTNSANVTNTDGWLINIDNNGAVEWHKTYGWELDETFNHIVAADYGGYLIAGETYSFDQLNGNGWLVKVDNEGGITSSCNIVNTFPIFSNDTNAQVEDISVTAQEQTISVIDTFIFPAERTCDVETFCFSFITDSDNDHLADDIEILIGSDPNNTDSDNDTISDGDEYYILGTDPTDGDSDDDGFLDPDDEYPNDASKWGMVVAVEDHFNDGVLNPAWQIEDQTNVFEWLHEESGTELVTTELVPEVIADPSVSTYLYLTRSFDPITDFRLDFDFSWDEEDTLTAMQSIFIALYDENGQEILVSGYYDAWISSYGSYYARLGSDIFNPRTPFPTAGNASLFVQRSDGNIDVYWDGKRIISGTNNQPVTKIAILFKHSAYDNGTVASTFGSESVDYIRLAGLPQQYENFGLEAYYPFEGNAVDGSLNGHDGVEYNGLNYQYGVIGQAANFDGMDDYINIEPTLSLTNDFTISAWIVKPDHDGTFFSIRDQCETSYRGWSQASFGAYYDYQYYAVNKTSTCEGGSGGDRYHNEAMAIPKDVPVMASLTVTSNAMEQRTVNLYLNDQLVNVVQYSDAETESSFSPERYYKTYIGAQSDLSSYFSGFKGLMDDLRIYARALSDKEIIALYNRTLPADSDFDTLPDAIESLLGTYPNDADTDDDGIIDGLEYYHYKTDPLSIDSDGDLVQDGTEVGLTDDDVGSATDPTIFQPDYDPTTTTDPTDSDTDNDGWLDGEEDLNKNGMFEPGETNPFIETFTCESDFDFDWDVDGQDFFIFIQNYGREDCVGDCLADFDYDGIVGLYELPIFSEQFGETFCPLEWRDSDQDGVLDDGDFSGLAGDNPCLSDNNGECDDNCLATFNPAQTDFDEDGFGAACDCDDSKSNIAPSVEEICDGIDNNCDGQIDEGCGSNESIITRTISIDGDATDWDGINPVLNDPENDEFGDRDGDDIKALYLAKDSDNLYLYLELWEDVNINFRNSPPPYNGRYSFYMMANTDIHPGIAYDQENGQWSLGYNGSNTNVPPDLQGPEYVGVNGKVVELKVPLPYLNNLDEYSFAATVFDGTNEEEWDSTDLWTP